MGNADTFRAHAAWTPTELTQDESWRIPLSRSAAQALATRVKSLAGRPLQSIGPKDAEVPELRDGVEAASHELFDAAGKGFAVWSNLPIEGLTEGDAEVLYCILGYQFGIPVTQSRAADIVAHVRNEPGVGTQYRGYKSSVRLDFHSDFTHVAALLCLRPAKSGGESAVVSAARAFNVLQETRPDLAEALRGEFFLGRVREEAPGEKTYLRQPIVALRDGSLGAFYIRKLVDQAQEYPEVPRLSALQIEALNAFEQVCNRPDVQYKFFMGQGEAFLLNNYRVFHARTDFEDSDDPKKRRHLMRLWIETGDDARRRDRTPESVRFDYHYGNIGLSPADVAAGRVRPL